MVDSNHTSGLTPEQVRAGVRVLQPTIKAWQQQTLEQGIRETWRLLRLEGWIELAAFDCGQIEETRAQRVWGHTIRYVRTIEDAVEAASLALGQRGHYVVPATLTDGIETLADFGAWTRAKTTAKEANVLRSRVLVIDCDPERAPNTSSTKLQWFAAIGTASCIVDHLRRHGVAQEALGIAHSGNGAHVHIYLDSEWSDAIKKLRVRVLRSLEASCHYIGPSATIKIDQAMSDGARYVPLYGTEKRKGGKGHPERPWRRTAVVGAAEVVPLDADALSRLADALEASSGTNQAHRKHGANEARPKRGTIPAPLETVGSAEPAPPTTRAIERRIESYVAKLQPATSGEGGHKTAFRAICNVARGFSLDVDTALRLLEPWNARCSPPWSERELRHKVEDALEKGQHPEMGAFFRENRKKHQATDAPRAEGNAEPTDRTSRDVPAILLGVDTDRVIDDAVAALAKDPDVYSRGTTLVRAILTDDGLETFELPATVLRLVHLARSAGWWIEDEGELVQTKAPSDIANAVHQLQVWRGIRPLINIVDVPVMRADGTVLDRAGYDQTTRLLYVPRLEFGEIPANPCHNDAIAARDRVLEIVKDFPLLESARTAWLALILSYFGRPMYSGPTPGFVIDANVRGCGKGLLADATGVVCLGARLPVTTPTIDEDELRKRITSTLMRGKGIVLVDNLPNDGELGNATWDRLLTGSRWEDRVLGASQLVTVPNATLWVFTVNNVQVKGDTSRRIIHIRLETPLEYPEHRRPQDFAHADLLVYVEERRVSFVRDVLTMLRAWVVAGRPRGGVSLGSFEGWCANIAACVEWLGMGNVTLTQAEYRERSTAGGGDATPLRPLMAAWRKSFGAAVVTATTLLRAVHEEDERIRREQRRLDRASRVPADDDGTVGLDAVDTSDLVHRYQDLRDALLAFAPSGRGGLPTPAWLGRKLSGALRRVVGGYRFEGKEDRDGVTHWSLVPLDAPAATPTASASECGGNEGGTAEAFSEPVPAYNPLEIGPPNGSRGGSGGIFVPPREKLESPISDLAEPGEILPGHGAAILPPLPPQGQQSSINSAPNAAGAFANLAPAHPPHAPAVPPQPGELSAADAAFTQFLIESV